MASQALRASTSLLSIIDRISALTVSKRQRPAIRAAREYMETHYAEDISIARLATLVSLSPHHFARAFGREVGIPPHTYLEIIRIRKAREFLDRGDTVVSAALSAGFVDQSHLTHRFKRFLGITPGKYAKRNMAGQDPAPVTQNSLWRNSRAGDHCTARSRSRLQRLTSNTTPKLRDYGERRGTQR